MRTVKLTMPTPQKLTTGIYSHALVNACSLSFVKIHVRYDVLAPERVQGDGVRAGRAPLLLSLKEPCPLQGIETGCS